MAELASWRFASVELACSSNEREGWLPQLAPSYTDGESRCVPGPGCRAANPGRETARRGAGCLASRAPGVLQRRALRVRVLEADLVDLGRWARLRFIELAPTRAFPRLHTSASPPARRSPTMA